MKKLLLVSLLSFAAAQAYANTGPYVEGNLGYSYTSETVTQNFFTQDSQHFGFNFNAGMMFFGFGAEAGYSQYGAPWYQGAVSQQKASYLNGTHLALKTQQNIGPIFFTGKIGYGRLNEGGFTLDNQSVASRSGGGLYWSFGGGFQFTPNIYTQVTYEQTQGSNGIPNATMVMIGVGYIF